MSLIQVNSDSGPLYLKQKKFPKCNFLRIIYVSMAVTLDWNYTVAYYPLQPINFYESVNEVSFVERWYIRVYLSWY
jgi:hypothetical protein